MMIEQKQMAGTVSHPLATAGSTDLPLRLSGKAERFRPITCSTHVSAEDTTARWQKSLPNCEQSQKVLMDAQTVEHISCFQGNIENFIGTVKVPVGLAGPLRVNGLFAQGDYAIPLATTEAALVASYHRGAQLISEGGACSAILLDEAVGRAPTSPFLTLAQLSMA